MQLLCVQSEGSKERFDAVLASFGFSGISSQTDKVTRSLVNKPVDIKTDQERADEGLNLIPNYEREHVKNRFFTFTVKRKLNPIRLKSRKSRRKGGPYTVNPGTGVKVPNPQLLNERIKYPIFKSRYPRRKIKSNGNN